MVRLAIRPLIVASLCAAALAGCGGGEGSAGSLDNALAYLPADAPLVVAIGTDLEGSQAQSIEKIAERFPFADQARQRLEESLSSQEFDFENDVKPLLGNEFVVGVPDVEAVVDDASGDRFVAAIEAEDQGKLEELFEQGDTKEAGEQNGAKLYEDSDGDIAAIEEGVLIVAGERELLDAALEQRDADDSLSAETFEEALAGLPEEALVRVYADVEQLLVADPETQQARKVEWLAALRTFGLTIGFEDDRAMVDFRLATDEEGLAEEDLPIAAGPESPEVIDSPDEIGFGLRGPEQVLAFAEAAGQAVDPAGFGDYSAGKQALEARLDVSIEEDLFGQLEDDLSMSVGLDGTFGVRASVTDPVAFTGTLDKLGEALPDIAENVVGEPVGYAKPKRGEDFYALATADGDSVVYGVVDGVFVLANDTRRATTLAEDETKAVEGAEGAMAMSTPAAELATQAIGRFGERGFGGALGASIVAEPLDQLTGSLAVETDGMTGRLVLTFD